MVKAYPAIIHFDVGGYWVEFPDLPGCFSEGNSPAEAIAEASAALGGQLASMMDRGLPMPEPSRIQAIETHGEDFASMIVADLRAFQKRTKSVKKTLTIPAWLNEAAESRSVNFSQLLQDALKRELGLAN